jgi:3,4-dihydroxy 2-butanone 4-phosphate synthase/GTP cyclohydrolase II
LHQSGRGFSIEQAASTPGQLPLVLYHTRGQVARDLAQQRSLQHESGIGAQILIDLGLTSLRVLTNHPRRLVALEGYGLTITEQLPLVTGSSKTTHQKF